MIRSGVYVLQFPNGMVYVGQAADIDHCIQQHASGGVPCTEGWGGNPIEMTPLTPMLEEAWERVETLERMQLHGIEKVRGWLYTSGGELPETILESIESQLCEKYDQCRFCGGSGHFHCACPMHELHRDELDRDCLLLFDVESSGETSPREEDVCAD